MAPYILPTVIVVYIWKWVLDVNHGLMNTAFTWPWPGPCGMVRDAS